MSLPDPKAMHERADWLCAAVVAIREGRPVPEPAAQWLATGVEQFLSTPRSSLDAALGLQVPPGGGHRTIWQVARDARRDQLLLELSGSLQCSPWNTAQILSEWLSGTRRQFVEPTARQAELLGRLVLCKPPHSVSQLYRLLRDLHQRANLQKSPRVRHKVKNQTGGRHA